MRCFPLRAGMHQQEAKEAHHANQLAASVSFKHGLARDLAMLCLDHGSPAKAMVAKTGVMLSQTVWPSGLRRWLQAPVRKGVGSNPTAVTFSSSFFSRLGKRIFRACVIACWRVIAH